MRKILIFTALLFATSCVSVHSASSTIARQSYNRIEKNLKNYTRVKADLMNESTEGGQLVAYFEKGAPRKIVTRHYGETGRAIREFYFAGGRLFFVLHTELRYDMHLGYAIQEKKNVKVVSRKQNRYYFSGGKLTRWIDENAKTRAASDEQFKQNALTLVHDARRLLKESKALLN